MNHQAVQLSESNHGAADVPLSPKEVLGQVQAIQHIMKASMKPKEHYGVIPGCGDKPTLLKPGAEKLMLAFRLAPDYVILPLFPGDEDKIGYRVECRIHAIASGKFLGAGLGEASTEEEKWKWRKAVNDEEYDDTDHDRTRIKYGVNYQTKQNYQIKQVRTNPADQANTVLKMAKKRALVDAILTVCAASDIFTQDLEEMPRETIAEPGAPPVQEPKPDQWVKGVLLAFEAKVNKSGNTKGKPHKLSFEVEGMGSVTVSAFTLPDGWDEDALVSLMNEELEFQYSVNGKFKNLTKLRMVAPDERPSESEAEQSTLDLRGNP